MKTLIIDNYDSYTYNLLQLVSVIMGEEPLVIKNDEMSIEEIKELDFDNIIISPGPGRPDKKKDFGVCKDVILSLDKPILGVCLGQQGIFYLNGGIIDYNLPVHGEISKIYHNNNGVFKNIKNGFNAVRYHSLICIEDDKLENINIDAKTKDNIIMGISHKTKPVWGVQFHPESICTEYGDKIIQNFYDLTIKYYAHHSPVCYEILDLKYSGKQIFQRLYCLNPKVLWLDSSEVIEDYSRFSIFGLPTKNDHILTYNINEKKTLKIYSDKTETYDISIFDFLKKNSKNWKVLEELPFDFQLGYIGYLGYELKEDTIVRNRHTYQYDDSYLQYVSSAVVLDHKENKAYILWEKEREDYSREIKKYLEKEMINTDCFIKKKSSDFPKVRLVKNKKEYIKDIERSKKFIQLGETYEICLTNRIDVDATIEPTAYYMILRELNPTPYSAFLNFKDISIASSSMERFLKIDRNGKISTKPIKGTIRRGKDVEEDKKLIKKLSTDLKTRAENLMIVDLLRNDLGKVCKSGTITVPKLMVVETYKTLHQLVTTIEGYIDDKYDVVDVIKAAFPGGSMTGAPKKRTLQIIDELENIPRGVYSGSIGYIANNNTADLNIVIRTAIIEKEKTSFGVGGAIINLSEAEEEFEEILLKAKGILNALKVYYNKSINYNIKIEGSDNEN